MLFQKTFAATLTIIFLFGNVIAQQNPSSTNKLPEISAELRKNAVEFLRQTIKEIPNLKAEENRRYFTIESARLLWKYDEKEARAMFESAMQEVKQSFAKTSEKYKKAVEELRKARKNANTNYGYANAVNGPAEVYPSNRYYGNANSYDEPKISVFEVGMADEFRKMYGLRRNLLSNLIEADAILAFQLLTETNRFIPEETDVYNYSENDSRVFAQKIAAKLLEKNEVDKSVELARDVLDKDFSEGFLEILSNIYEKDAVKGSNLAEEILLQNLTISSSGYGNLSIFFDQAVESKNQKQPMLSEKSLRELARLLGQSVLAEMDDEYYFTPYEYAKRIEKYAPREALKILQKSKQKRKNNPSYYPSNAANYYPSNKAMNRVSYPSNAAVNAARAAANAASEVAIMATNRPKPAKPKTKPKKTPEIVEPVPVPEYDPMMDIKDDLIQKLRVGKFTPEERKEVIKQVKEYALAENYYGYARPDGFIRVVAELARYSLFSSDKEVADELMKEAEVYVRPKSKNYADYIVKLLLAGGYSSHHPEKSFALMESMVTINDVIESAVKFGMFFDVQTDLILGDEVSALFFLGDNGGIGKLPKEVEFRIFIHNLAKADFQRTKGLAEKFEKREVKMAAKMLILNSLLGEAN